MRTLALLLLAGSAFGTGVSTKVISPQVTTQIVLSQDSVTALLFPSQFTGVYAKGIVFQDKGAPAAKKDPEITMGGYFSAGKPVLTLYAKIPDLRTSLIVYMDGQIYPFEVVSGPNPDIAVTLVTGRAEAAKSVEVTPQQVVDARPKYSDALLVSLKERAQTALFRQKFDPRGYRGYEHRSCQFIMEDERFKTVVTDLHKFPIEDAVVIEGTIKNLGASEIKPGEIRVSINDVKRPVTFSTWTRGLPPGASVPVVLELVGGESGNQVGLSIWENEFRIIPEAK